jgi:hypothetical protein
MKKLILIIIGLTISISVMAEAHGVNLLAQSPTVTPSPFVTDKTGKASESKGNVLPHNQRGSNSNLKRGQHTPLSTNQPRANSPYSGNLINQNYSNNPGPKRGRNIFTGRDQSKLNQGNARPRSHRD